VNRHGQKEKARLRRALSAMRKSVGLGGLFLAGTAATTLAALLSTASSLAAAFLLVSFIAFHIEICADAY
jgi:hypothetical protein